MVKLMDKGSNGNTEGTMQTLSLPKFWHWFIITGPQNFGNKPTGRDMVSGQDQRA